MVISGLPIRSYSRREGMKKIILALVILLALFSQISPRIGQHNGDDDNNHRDDHDNGGGCHVTVFR
jgi:hypothetical protein